MKVRYATAALDDIARIHRYIAADDLSAADRMSEALLESCESLDDLSERGRNGRKPGTRELHTVRPYVIVYSVTSKSVRIARVRHAAELR